MVSRVRFALAQLGRKPGGGESLRRLMEAEDLPGSGWKVIDKRTLRTGLQRPVEPWSLRAAEAGSVIAWRSFRQSDRGLWAQLVPLASAEDAAAALGAVPTRMLRNLRAKVKVESETEVEGIEVDGAGATWAFEQHTTGHKSAGVSRMMAWTVGSDLFVMAGSGVPEWTWADLKELADRQSARAGA